MLYSVLQQTQYPISNVEGIMKAAKAGLEPNDHVAINEGIVLMRQCYKDCAPGHELFPFIQDWSTRFANPNDQTTFFTDCGRHLQSTVVEILQTNPYIYQQVMERSAEMGYMGYGDTDILRKRISNAIQCLLLHSYPNEKDYEKLEIVKQAEALLPNTMMDVTFLRHMANNEFVLRNGFYYFKEEDEGEEWKSSSSDTGSEEAKEAVVADVPEEAANVFTGFTSEYLGTAPFKEFITWLNQLSSEDRTSMGSVVQIVTEHVAQYASSVLCYRNLNLYLELQKILVQKQYTLGNPVTLDHTNNAVELFLREMACNYLKTPDEA